MLLEMDVAAIIICRSSPQLKSIRSAVFRRVLPSDCTQEPACAPSLIGGHLYGRAPAFAGDEASTSVSQADSAALPDSPGTTKFAAEQTSTSADESSSKSDPLPDADSQLVTNPSSDKIQWKPMLIQTLEFTVFQHAWRAAFDPGLRYLSRTSRSGTITASP